MIFVSTGTIHNQTKNRCLDTSNRQNPFVAFILCRNRIRTGHGETVYLVSNRTRQRLEVKPFKVTVIFQICQCLLYCRKRIIVYQGTFNRFCVASIFQDFINK